MLGTMNRNRIIKQSRMSNFGYEICILNPQHGTFPQPNAKGDKIKCESSGRALLKTNLSCSLPYV